MAEIILDPLSVEDEEKIKKALDAISTCTGTEINYESLSVLKIIYKGNPELENIIKILAKSRIKTVKIHGNRYTSKITPLKISEQVMEKSIDPLGS